MIPNLAFLDMFDVASPVGNPPSCPAGYSYANTVNELYTYTAGGIKYYYECLKVRGWFGLV